MKYPFFIIFEWLPLKQIKKIFLEGESPTLSITENLRNVGRKRVCSLKENFPWKSKRSKLQRQFQPIKLFNLDFHGKFSLREK